MSLANIFLVLSFEHPLRAADSVAERMAAGLAALGLDARVCSLPRDAARLAACAPAEVAGVLSLGPLPVSLSQRVHGRWLWQQFDCPITLFTLDAFIYDLARVQAMQAFVAAARQDSRLGLLSPEIGYRDWLNPALGLNWQHLPFGAFARVLPGAAPVQPQPRLCVIGTVGAELGASPPHERLPELLNRVLALHAGALARQRLAEALQAADAPAMPARAVVRELGWDPETALSGIGLQALTAIDSWVKRDRRLRAVRSLIGLPLDFYGAGWHELLGDVPGFRHVGQVSHDDIALVLPYYAGVLNFDPNWEGGVHDRVYTAAAMGVPVLTNFNTGLAEARLPPDLVLGYDANRPALGELVAGRWAANALPRTQALRPDVIASHGWGTRMAQWLSAGSAPQIASAALAA
jgi:hypothetical protein